VGNHEWLSRDIEDINNYLKKENVEEMYVTEVSNAKYIKNYLNGRGFKNLTFLIKMG
jgi:serine/threonine-protein kinase RIO1